MRITLCGSTRFKAEFEAWNRILSLMGHIVYSVSCYGHSGDILSEEQKIMLDKVHKAKILNSDMIFVLDVGEYIGSSTRSEIEFAIRHNKQVRYLSKDYRDMNNIPTTEITYVS